MRIVKDSASESITPSTGANGVHAPPSTEYSQARSGDAASFTSTCPSQAAPLRDAAPTVTTGGVRSIKIGALTIEASRALGAGFESRSLTVTRNQ